VPGVCAYPKELKEVAAHHGTLHPPDNWEHKSFKDRHLVRIIPEVRGLWTPFVHSDCVCNEIVSATNRVLAKVPLPTDDGLKRLKDMARQLVGGRTFEPWTLERVVESFKGSRRRLYQNAYEDLKHNPIWEKDAYIKAFIKGEKTDPFAKINPDPRMIQARSPRYNLKVAQYLRPIEHFIYNLRGKSGYRDVAKGLNQEERARTLIDKFSLFDKPVCFSVDCSRWDQHVSEQMLRLEHWVYKQLVPDVEFSRLLEWQVKNRCFTKNGCKYTAVGGRMSGDINTALGNVLLMVLQIRTAMRNLGFKDHEYEIFDDGDDLLVIVEERDFEYVQANLVKEFLKFGQELKIENIAREINDIVFCQSKIVYNGEHFIFCRDWRKILSHATSGTKYWNDPNLVRPMMGLVGACELALSSGIPIIQEYAAALVRMSRGKVADFKNLESGYLYRLKSEVGDLSLVEAYATSRNRERLITERARYEFEKTFGISKSEQLLIESQLRLWDLETTESRTVPVEWDHTWTDYRTPGVLISERN